MAPKVRKPAAEAKNPPTSIEESLRKSYIDYQASVEHARGRPGYREWLESVERKVDGNDDGPRAPHDAPGDGGGRGDA